MQDVKKGRVVGSVGGIFEVLCEGGERLCVRARGNLRRGEGKLLVGDLVRVSGEESDAVIEAIKERQNSLIRPPLANLDHLFVALSVREPSPIPETTDKLLAIAEHNGIDVTVVVTKEDASAEAAEELAALYRTAGYPVFTVSSYENTGIDELAAHLQDVLTGGKTAAFAGASGVGKSSLMNRLFPDLCLETGEISQKIGRGKNTTRTTVLYPVFGENGGFLADTPGFSMLDFIRFDFMTWQDLPNAFREFAPYLGQCRYANCRHVKEEECAVRRALADGRIPVSRYESYVSLYTVLKDKSPYGNEK
ncbi:MAG: ribosome small subunit-dependent GTPase A [Clostridia bacterium]|nr:ribosome small subunit-dependent GTPase A [Clostridia bacterium]